MLRDIAQGTSMSKPGVHKILSNLESRGYVRRALEGGSYSLGLRLWELGASVGWLTALTDRITPFLHDLSNALGEASHLVVLDREEVVYVARSETRHAVKVYGAVGDRAPAHCVATGKVLLASRAIADQPVPAPRCPRYTPTTITDPEAFRQEQDVIRAQGYALNNGEWREGVNGVAVPLPLTTERSLLAIGVSGPSYRFTLRAAREAVPALQRLTGQLEPAVGPVTPITNLADALSGPPLAIS